MFDFNKIESELCSNCFQDAENAITTMNGQWLGGRTIKTNWASGKGNLMNLTRVPGTLIKKDNSVNGFISYHI